MDYAMIGILTAIGVLSGGLAALVGGGADVLIVPMMLMFSVFLFVQFFGGSEI